MKRQNKMLLHKSTAVFSSNIKIMQIFTERVIALYLVFLYPLKGSKKASSLCDRLFFVNFVQLIISNADLDCKSIDLYLMWLATKISGIRTVSGGCIPSKNKFKPQKNTDLRWLASDINFKLLHIGCPIAHEETFSR